MGVERSKLMSTNILEEKTDQDLEWLVVVDGLIPEAERSAYHQELEAARVRLCHAPVDQFHILWPNSPQDMIDFASNLVADSKKVCMWLLYDRNDVDKWIEAWNAVSWPASWRTLAPSSAFARCTSNKLAMKIKFHENQVPTSPWATTLDELREKWHSGNQRDWFIKAVAGCACWGQSESSRWSGEEWQPSWEPLWQRLDKHCVGGIFAEHFVPAREATVLVAGVGDNVIALGPVERVFPRAGKDGFMQENVWDNFEFQGVSPQDEMHAVWRQLAIDAYRAIGGDCYARVDVRGNYVLEVNSLPSFALVDTRYSMAAILAAEPDPLLAQKQFWQRVCATAKP
eukprot:TRINITY_DN407_c0_g1_i2.p1 TRINITY_DN407_c0_g1~~TRINITY_DN407_c0_g1_i2.p1  ORF type:complete len:352 (+),score=75.09 TRINITY_DN407_c0_g1_i2:33-1058(+)